MAEKQQLLEIVKQLHNGDKNVAAMLYEAYYRDLHYYILKRVNDPGNAEVLTQETFLELFETISTLDNAEHFVEWSRQIADRKCDQYKKSRRELLLHKVGESVVGSVEEERKELRVEQEVAILASYVDEKKVENESKKSRQMEYGWR